MPIGGDKKNFDDDNNSVPNTSCIPEVMSLSLPNTPTLEVV